MNADIEEIVRQISSKPNDMLALGRTLMASKRTFLGTINTSVCFLGGGIGIIKYLHDPLLIALGFVLIFSAFFTLIIGYKNYRDMDKLLSQAYEVIKSPQAVTGKHASNE